MGVPKRDGGAAYVWEGKYVKKIQWQHCPLGNTRAKKCAGPASYTQNYNTATLASKQHR